MAKIVRKVAKIFGQTAGANQIAQFGSLANSTPNFTTDPTVIQALSQWLNGWFDAAIGSNSPAIEDMNAFCYVLAYQIAYLMQEGVAEWDAATTYYIGSVVNDGFGFLYVSVINTNTSALTTADWKCLNGLTKNASTGSRTIVSGESLTQPLLNIQATNNYIVNSGGSLFSFNSITVQPGGSLTVAPGGIARII